MEYVKIAKLKDFETESMKTFRLLARPVGVFKREDGTFYAMEMSCKHENADLSEGRIEGDVVTCTWHGWKYDLRTGECLWGCETRLRQHGLKIQDDAIYVTLRPLEYDESLEGQEDY